MSVTLRSYSVPDDYRRVDEFLVQHYRPDNADRNWLQPAWEYMHGHPYLDRPSLGRIGIWEDAGRIVAVAHYESRLGEAFFQFHPDYRRLGREMLDYAEERLCDVAPGGRKRLHVYAGDADAELTALLRERGYERDAEEDRPVAQLPIPDPFPPIHLPPGFRLESLAEDCDWAKVHRVMWRGFNHAGEPPVEDLEERKTMQDTPGFRRDLKIVVAAPGGDFVSFCGMWHEPVNRYAYVEPVATDPAYRRMGLGSAAVLEGIRRCGALGASVAYVGSDLAFYRSLGFQAIYTSECWARRFV